MAIEINEMVLSSELKTFPNGFWTAVEAKDNVIEITKYLFESILKWTNEHIKEKLNIKVLLKYKLYGMCGILFGGCAFRTLDTVYPGRFKAWELHTTTGYGNDSFFLAPLWLIVPIPPK